MCRDVAPDIFWQLKDGERIVREWRLPVREDYSFTASGRSMVATEWLAEAAAYIVFRAAGYGGLVALHTALFLLTFIFLLALIRRRLPPLPSLCLLSLAAFAFVNFYEVKAQNWTFLFTALFLYWAELWENGNEGVAWAMSALLLPWANMHGGFMVGWAILALICLRRAWETRRLAALAPWGLGTLLCCAHPNGATALVYPLWFMAAPPPGRAMIAEWRALNFGEAQALPYLMILVFLLWSGLAGVSMRFPWGAFTLVLAILALRGRKLLPEFTLAAIACLALKLRPANSRGEERALGAAALLALGMTGWVVLGRAGAPSVLHPARDWERAYPGKAVELIAARYPGRRIFHDYDWGGFLIYKLYPRNLVFIDGRLDPYWRLLPGDYTTLMEERPGWRALLDDYGITLALLKPTDRLSEGLSRDPSWKTVYGDARCVLFAR